MTQSEVVARSPNWGFEMGYWMADGDPEPNVPFPTDWEVCGFPSLDPFSFGMKDKRQGQTCLAWPRYGVTEPMSELDSTCSFVETMTPETLATWLSLQDRYISMCCGSPEMDSANLSTHGFFIPPELIQRTRRLKIRLRVSFHPQSGTRFDITY